MESLFLDLELLPTWFFIPGSELNQSFYIDL